MEDRKMHILQYVGSKFCVKYQKVHFQILQNILNPYTGKYAFNGVLKFHDSWYLKVMTS